MLLQQPTCGHNHSSLTISALRDLLLKPRALARMTQVRRQSLNRDKTARRCLRRGNLTGAHCFSIFEHGACAANADSAAKFRASQSEIVTDEPKQWSIVVSFDNMSGPINREIDLAHDNDGDSDFDSRQQRRRACSNFTVTFNPQIGPDGGRRIDAAHDVDCSPVMIVTGSDGDSVARESEQTSATTIQNEDWQRGIGSSIRTGVQHLINHDPDVEAVLLLVCDQPLVDANTIRSLIMLRATTKKSIVASSYANTVGVPALFDRSLFKELLSLGNEAGAKSIILQNPEGVAQFPFPEGAVDIDTWDDWEKVNADGHPERSEGSG
jgi:molybdenum cofactor cytidylyltransferase